MAQKKCALCRRQIADNEEMQLLPCFLLPQKNPSLEVQNRIHSLCQTHIFCSDCCKRIKRLDKAYRASHFTHHHDPMLNYLFWMSVVWRIAISRTELHMQKDEEEKLRHVLNKHLPSSFRHWQAPPLKSLGRCAYRIQKVNRIYDEDLTLAFVHEPSCPYVIMIGPYVLKWYSSIHLYMKVADKVGDERRTINIGLTREKVEKISVWEYMIDLISIEETNHIYDRKMSSWMMQIVPDVTTIRPFSRELRDMMNRPVEDMNERYGNRVDVIDRWD